MYYLVPTPFPTAHELVSLTPPATAAARIFSWTCSSAVIGGYLGRHGYWGRHLGERKHSTSVLG